MMANAKLDVFESRGTPQVGLCQWANINQSSGSLRSGWYKLTRLLETVSLSRLKIILFKFVSGCFMAWTLLSPGLITAWLQLLIRPYANPSTVFTWTRPCLILATHYVWPAPGSPRTMYDQLLGSGRVRPLSVCHLYLLSINPTHFCDLLVLYL